jgi:FkbM family methyltransferase
MDAGRPGALLNSFGRKLVKAGRLLGAKRYRRGLRMGVAAAIEHAPAMAELEVSVVVDVGANKGQFSLLARQRWPQAFIYAFEPLDAAAASYRAVFTRDALTRLQQSAVGDVPGKADLHISRRQDSSSLLPVGELQNRIFPGTEETGTVSVPVVRLQDVLRREDLGEAALLKIDVQGYELQVLKGAGELLRQFKYVYAECSSLELYTGQALAHEVSAHLDSSGFRLLNAFNATTNARGDVVQADYLFERIA